VRSPADAVLPQRKSVLPGLLVVDRKRRIRVASGRFLEQAVQARVSGILRSTVGKVMWMREVRSLTFALVMVAAVMAAGLLAQVGRPAYEGRR